MGAFGSAHEADVRQRRQDDAGEVDVHFRAMLEKTPWGVIIRQVEEAVGSFCGGHLRAYANSHSCTELPE